jgi:hypothetical protein
MHRCSHAYHPGSTTKNLGLESLSRSDAKTSTIWYSRARVNQTTTTTQRTSPTALP